MALLSGEVETWLGEVEFPVSVTFRMALLSGEVETFRDSGDSGQESGGSGWLCYPGKLKHAAAPLALRCGPPGFRMALLSGEVETAGKKARLCLATTVPDGFAIRGS